MKKIIKKFLSSYLMSGFKRFFYKVDYFVMCFFSMKPFLSSFYYLLFSREFDREHAAVLRGRLEYINSLMKKGSNNSLLRRNIHRLEKGLIMRPRREKFAEEYIGETVSCFSKSLGCNGSIGEVKWAGDVIEEYFSIVGNSKIIDDARSEFLMLKKNDESGDKHYPYPHRELPDLSITYEQLLVLFKRRRAVRWYLDENVDNSFILKAINAATLAPSACNRQPFRFYVANNREQESEIAGYAMGTAGFSNNIPCLIAIVGDLSAYPMERDRHVIYIDGALAAMKLMLAFETLGLSTCPINWPDIESREELLSKKLKLPYHERPIMLLSVGYADPEGGVAFSHKKDANDLIVML